MTKGDTTHEIGSCISWYGQLTRRDNLRPSPPLLPCAIQLIFSAFKTLTGQQVTIELKNDLAIQGTLKSVDQ